MPVKEKARVKVAAENKPIVSIKSQAIGLGGLATGLLILSLLAPETRAQRFDKLLRASNSTEGPQKKLGFNWIDGEFNTLTIVDSLYFNENSISFNTSALGSINEYREWHYDLSTSNLHKDKYLFGNTKTMEMTTDAIEDGWYESFGTSLLQFCKDTFDQFKT